MPATHTTEITALLEGIVDGRVALVELTQPLSERTAIIELPPPFANSPRLSRQPISCFDERGPEWAWYTLTLGEHTGTHVDAPVHWLSGRNGDDVASIPLRQLVGPACVVDKTAETEQDPGYLLTVADLHRWESDHGRMPDGAWVLMRTGWGRRADNEATFLNATESGPITPGPDVEACRWLAHERSIAGFGVETVGIDAGAAPGFDVPSPAHHFLLGAGRVGVTQLANLEFLPMTGALMVVAPMRLVGGTGSPCRVIAFVPQA